MILIKKSKLLARCIMLQQTSKLEGLPLCWEMLRLLLACKSFPPHLFQSVPKYGSKLQLTLLAISTYSTLVPQAVLQCYFRVSMTDKIFSKQGRLIIFLQKTMSLKFKGLQEKKWSRWWLFLIHKKGWMLSVLVALTKSLFSEILGSCRIHLHGKSEVLL